MQAHGRAGRVRILAGNRLINLFVFAAQAAHVVLLVIMGQARRIQAGTRNDAGAQVGHDVGEVAVAGGQRNFQMERKI